MIFTYSTFVKRLFIFALLICANSIQAQKSKAIKPKRFVSTIPMRTQNSDFIYYALSSKSLTTIEVKGPGTLTIYNRVKIEDGTQNSDPYYLKYTINGKQVGTKKVPILAPSTKVWYRLNKTSDRPSKAKKVTLKIPPGKHRITFVKRKTKQKAHARFEFKADRKETWVEQQDPTLTPVTLQYVKNKKQNTYSRIDKTQKFHITTDGNNSKIRVFLRGDFTYRMLSENTLRLELSDAQGCIKTFKITTKKSSSVENLTDKSLIPGTLEKFYIDLPVITPGSYTLSLKNAKRSAMVRVFLNQKQTPKPNYK